MSQPFAFQIAEKTYSAQIDSIGVTSCPCPYHPEGGDLQYPLHSHFMQHVKTVQQISSFTPTFLSQHLAETPIFAQYGLAINTQYKLLLCLSCGYAIIPTQLKSHLMKSHRMKLEVVDKQEMFQVLSHCGVDLSKLPELHHSVISEIEGLPLLEGYPCPSCLVARTGYESLKTHMCQSHKGVPYPLEPNVIFIQQLKKSSDLQAIRIHTPKDLPTRFTTPDILFQATNILKNASCLPATEESEDARSFCPWLRRIRWHELSKGKDISKLIALVEHPEYEEFSSLSDGLQYLLSSGSLLFDSTPELILQCLNTSKPVDDINPRPFKRMQKHEETLKQYSVPVIGLLAMLLRDCPIPVTPEIQLSIESLRSALASQDSHIVSEQILSVLGLIWQNSWTPLINHRISDPTIIYLALWSLEPTGKFKSAKYVTSPIAKLEYVLRLIFLILINRHPESHEAGYQMYKHFFKEGVETTFNALCNAQRQASSIAYLSQELPKVWWLDRKQYRELLYKGTHIHIEQIHALLSALEQRIMVLWEKEILLGFGLGIEYKEIVDDLSNTEVGYSFMTDPRNTCFSGSRVTRHEARSLGQQSWH